MEEFRKFIARGNVMDLAVGLVIGAAFATVIGSFVEDILMPPSAWRWAAWTSRISTSTSRAGSTAR